MTDIFIKAFNMSVSAAWIVPAVIAVRFLLKKAPRWTVCLLWGIVGLRLLLPFSFKSIFSLIPSAETLPHDILTSPAPHIHTGISALNSTVNPVIEETAAENGGFMETALFTAAIFWAVGIVASLLYGAVSYIRLKRRVAASIKLEDNVYICDGIDSPFILGFLFPKIYLPSALDEKQRDHVMTHERAHIKRLDHIIKPLGFLLLSIHWFNPLLWVSYILLCRDIEKACDERAVRDMNAEGKKGYSETLLACSSKSRLVSACPLAFGEVGVKSRIKSVLSYKKPALWIIIAAIVLSIILSVCFLTDPKDKKYPVAENPAITFLGCTSKVDGVSALITDFVLVGDDPYMVVEYNNKSSDTFSYGKMFDILYKEETGYISCATEEHYFLAIGLMLKAGGTTTETYSLSGFDLSRVGEYRFSLGSRENRLLQIDFEITEATVSSIGGADGPDSLIYSGVGYAYDGAPDLDVPIINLFEDEKKFSFSYSHFSSDFIHGTYTLTDTELTLMTDDGTKIFRFIPEDDTFVFSAKGSSAIPSYKYSSDSAPQTPVPDGAVFKKLPRGAALFPIIDFAYGDIDGDGVEEGCSLTYGPTSGIFSFRFAASNDKVSYLNTFSSDHMELSFEKDEKGKLYIVGEKSLGGRKVRFDISVKDGNILLSDSEKSVYYWGKQGK